jgi:hypothetical protein
VDYHEFMIGMTGSSQSFIETASEQDIDKLKAKFSEYATIKKREHLVKAIEERAQATATPLLLSAPQGGVREPSTPFPA